MKLTTEIVDRLQSEQNLSEQEFLSILNSEACEATEYLRFCAENVRKQNFGNSVYIRGLIEFTNYCKNDCLYCGIRRNNLKAERYRLTKEQILSCCENGYNLGFRTFVLQGGEDAYFTDEILCDIIENIKSRYPDCAVTLSIGERSKESYKRLFNAGAVRYLLRHETANAEHYAKLHSNELSLLSRMNCLKELKETGFQTGCGFMVGSPFQTDKNIVEDLMFIKKFNPQMVGIGPFIPHKDTPFKAYTAGTLEQTLRLLSIIRLILPKVLLPSTTALATINKKGRQLGILAGANVVMPNLSPFDVRDKYFLYNNKASFGAEAAESLDKLKTEMKEIGYNIVVDRGDYRP